MSVNKLDDLLKPHFHKSVLLIEDTKSILMTEKKMLNDIGFSNIVLAIDGQDAIQKLDENHDVGLIISDWNMPNLNGYEFLQWLRKKSQFRDVPFIMATSLAEKKQAYLAEDAGANFYLIKPFGPQELSKAIHTVFDTGNSKYKDLRQESCVSESGKVKISVAHIPITDHIVLGMLQKLISTKKLTPRHFELDIHSLLLWNPVQNKLDEGSIDAAFILAPIVMDLFSHGTPIKIVLLAHKNGSICIRNKSFGMIDLDQETLKNYFKGKVFYLPHTLSVHRILADIYLRELGLNPGYAGQENVDIQYEVIPPIMMPDFQAKDKGVGGFMVAEPIGAQAIYSNVGEELILSGQLWNDHPCCVVAMRDEFIQKYPEATHEFVNMLILAGQYVESHKKEAAQLAVSFLDPKSELGYTNEILEKVFLDSHGIKTHDLVPVLEDFDRIQKYMYDKLQMGNLIDLENLFELRFIKQ
jgi:ABC-type nitrate/sulfonate/bicarbonate transport system substrate-binding protein/AmiR/NasT family two-component response regulator